MFCPKRGLNISTVLLRMSTLHQSAKIINERSPSNDRPKSTSQSKIHTYRKKPRMDERPEPNINLSDF